MAEVSSQTLHLVARELASELNEARAALETFGEQQDNVALLRKCGEHLHSVHGALRVSEVYGAALLAEEMGQVTRYLLEHFAEKRHLAEGLDALMRAMVQLPTYLERVLSGGRDMALVLLPLLNDLRAVRGHALLSEGTLLLLNLSSDQQANPAPSAAGEGSLTVAQWARKLRTRFQLGLLGWIKGERVEQNLEVLSRTAEKLEQLATTQPVFQLWWVVGAVLEALREHGLEGSASVKRLLGQADRDLKRLYELGEARYAESPSLELLNNLLYYVARAQSTGPRVAAVRASFRLSELLPVDDNVEQARESLSAPSVKLMKTVAAAIKEDLGRVKDALDIFVRQGGTQVDELSPQLELLKKIADTLGVLGLGELRDKVQTETTDLQAIVSQRAPVSEGALLRMASTLIKVEDSLDEQLISMIVPMGDETPQKPAGAEDIEFRQVTEAVLRECIVNMARIKEAIAQSMEKPHESQAIEQIPPLVRGITAGLLMLGKPRVVEIMEGIDKALKQFMRSDGLTLPPDAVDRLADAIVAVEYYMETLQAGRADPWYMLDNAETCLQYLADTQAVPRVELQSTVDPVHTLVIDPLSQTVAAPTEHERTAVIDRVVPAPAPVPVVEASVAASAVAPPAIPPAMAAPLDREIDPEFLELFIEEAKDEIQRLQQYFPRWDENPQELDALTHIRRSFHTLKGSGRMVGAQLIGEFAWAIENLLNRIINKTLERSPDMMSLLREAVAAVPELVEQLEAGREPRADIGRIIAQAYTLAGGRPAGPGIPNSSARNIAPPRGELPKPAVAPVREAPPAAEVRPVYEPPEPPMLTTTAIVQPLVQVPEKKTPPQSSYRDPLSGLADQHLSAASELNPELNSGLNSALNSGLNQSSLDPAGLPPAAEPPQPADTAMEPALSEIYAKETAGHLATIREFIAACDCSSPPYAATEALHRSCHTLSGTAKTAGARQGIKIAEPLNRYVRKLYDHSIGLPVAGLEVLRDAVDAIQQVVDHINEDTGYFPNHLLLIARINELDHALDHEISRLAETVGFASSVVLPTDAHPSASSAPPTEHGVDAFNDDVFADVEQRPADATIMAPALTTPPAGESADAVADEMTEPPLPTVTDASARDLLDWSFQGFVAEREPSSNAANEAALADGLLSDNATREIENPLGGDLAQARDLPDGARQMEELIIGDDVQDIPLTPDWNESVIDGLMLSDAAPQESPAIPVRFDAREHRDFGAGFLTESEIQAQPDFDASEFVELQSTPDEALFDAAETATGIAFEYNLRSETVVPTSLDEALAQFPTHVDRAPEDGSVPGFDLPPLTDDELAAGELDLDAELLATANAQPPAQVEDAQIEDAQVDDLSDSELEFGPDSASVSTTSGSSSGALPLLPDDSLTDSQVIRFATEPDLSLTQERRLEAELEAALAQMTGLELTRPDSSSTAGEASALSPPESGSPADDPSAVDAQALAMPASTQPQTISTARVQPGAAEPVAEPVPVCAQEVSALPLADTAPPSAEPIVAARQSVSSPAVDAVTDEVPEEISDDDEVEANFDPDIAAIFTDEASELLEAADGALSAWQRDPRNNALIFELKRSVHTLKGGARMAGIRAMGDLSHEFETFMQLVEAGQVPASPEAFSTLQASLDELHRMRDVVSSGGRSPPARELMARIRALGGYGPAVATTAAAPEAAPAAMPIASLELPATAAAPIEEIEFEAASPLPTVSIDDTADVQVEFDATELGAAAPRESVRLDESRAPAESTSTHDVAAQTPELVPDEPEPAAPDEEIFEPVSVPTPALPPGREPLVQERQEFARVDADLLDTLLNNAGEVSIFRSRMEQQIGSIEFNLAELGRTVTRLREQLRKLELETEAEILHRHHEEHPERADFDPLELDRYSTIQQLTRAFAESVSDVGSIEGLLENLTREAQNLLLQQSRVVTELQSGLMRTRMVPFQRHVQRLSRLVRQVANDTGKQADLVVVGASGELDRQVLERMLPPFEHMLRNSVVHGIETPQERVAQGKPEGGTIKVGLHREGSEMVIVLEDDGRGIDVKAVRERAIARGMLQASRVLSDDEAMQLILEPGFSTASSITQHAGRGVGMDVVVTEIKKLGGTLFTQSVYGQGVKFTIRLPFTLAITQALIVRTGDEIYALPLPTVEGVARVPKAEVHKHLSEEAPTYSYGGQIYRLQHLGAFVGGGPSQLPEADVSVPLILIRAGEHSTALVCDELIGSREMVVKSVGPQIATIRGISGATILGDGRIVIILDMGTLVRSEWRSRKQLDVQAPTADQRTFALVVDDSITVRRVTQRLLERKS